ncbi:Mitogen-activated protein kinase-binding protein 1 [Cytospora mali]|uniref:Mitogen-activated protein kinase-binding protein 1 n=1 Tax=Cytospora mali TaxID=578113 RepID=A0A194V1A6_CYTMA|nr:Mitogen-activated protein kinase-binding protein 1 [Valsa mali var. pyri (nom. inval.)]
MASTPSNRQLKLTPSNTQVFSKTPNRSRNHEPRLFLKRVAGTTCCSPTGFDSVDRCFAYVAGGAAVVVDVEGGQHTQRFYRARPTAVPVFSVAPVQHGSSIPNTTPKANDARNRVAPRDSPSDRADSLASKTWTSRERIKAATCVSLSRDGRFLAVGETGYAPRVLIFSLQDGSSSDQPLMSLSEHGFGVRAVSWSQCGKYLASLGTANDGFLLIWKVDPRNGSARFLQQNRCTAQVNGMVWLGNTLVTFGTRHMKAWKVDDVQRPVSPPKKNTGRDLSAADTQRTLTGRNIVLGSLLEASFTCALSLGETHALVCSDSGDVCLLDDTSGQTKLARVAEMGFPVTCCTRRGPVAVVGGKDGQLVTLDVDSTLALSPSPARGESGLTGLTVAGVVQDQLVTIDPERSIDIWDADSLPTMSTQNLTRTRLAGQNDPILGIQPISTQEDDEPVFLTWSGSGKVFLWDLNGSLRKSFDIAVEDCNTGNDKEPLNQLCVVRADDRGRFFAAGDRVGVLRVVEYATGELLLETKAHSSEITHIAFHHDSSKTIIATCGRDRTVQLYSRTSNGSFDLLQTLEFPARVTNLILSSDDKIITCSLDRNMQIHELVGKEDEPHSFAAIHFRSIALKASPTSMALDSSCRTIFVSSVDRAIYQFDIESGRQINAFKCTDEKGTENVVVESLVFGSSKSDDEPSFLLGLSNTDKSVRVYDSNTGAFMDREWGHTESINGVALVDDRGTARKIVSVGCDGTIMIWDLNLRDPEAARTGSRSPPPIRDAAVSASRPPLRRVLSKAELAGYQRPTSSGGRRSPPRTLRQRKSKQNMAPSFTRTPTSTSLFQNTSPTSTMADDTPSRRPSSSRSGTSPPPPPDSPPSRRLKKRPSLPALGTTPSNPTARKKTSAINLRSSYGGPGPAQAASEQTCRQLRAFRKRLTSSSSEAISAEAMAELNAELHLTIAALGERASRAGGANNNGKQQQQPAAAVSEGILGELLEQYSEKLVGMLDERLKLRLSEIQGGGSMSGSETGSQGLLTPPIGLDREKEMERERPRTSGA